MEIAIFGGGIAGLMAAVTLRAQGHRCRIYERTSQRCETGMGFILMPEGIRCLEGFGVHLDGSLQGVSLHRYCCRNEAGEILHQQAMPAGAHGFRRRDLISALSRAMPKDEILVFGSELEGFRFDETGRVLEACLSSGQRVTADLYVAADGHRSRARELLFPGWNESPAQVFELVGLARCHSTCHWAGADFNKFHASNGSVALGVLPVDHEHLVWYLQFDTRRYLCPGEIQDTAVTAKSRHDFVQQLVGHWSDPIRHLLSITDFSRVHLWRPVDSDLIPSFYRKNLVLLGDAAHPLLPFTSQGVSSAIADAVTLAKALSAHKVYAKGVSSNGDYSRIDLESSLAAYSDERRAQCAPYIAKGRELSRQFLSQTAASHCWLPIAQ